MGTATVFFLIFGIGGVVGGLYTLRERLVEYEFDWGDVVEARGGFAVWQALLWLVSGIVILIGVALGSLPVQGIGLAIMVLSNALVLVPMAIVQEIQERKRAKKP